MTSEGTPQGDEELRRRIHELETANRQHLEFLDLVLSLDNSLVGIRQHKSSAALLAVVAAHVRRLLPSIDAIAFFVVQPDFSYECGHCDPPGATAGLTASVALEIENGVFGWALRQNRALVRPADQGAVVLHPVATPSRTIGMAVCRTTGVPEERAPGMALLSVILSTAAYALENASLYAEMTDRNVHLERLVEERTRKARAAQRQVEVASRAKSDFLSTLSHEIRTPLNGVMGTAELLLSTPLAPLQRAYGETIRRCGELTLGLVTDILDYTRVEAGSVALESRAFAPARVVDDVVLVVAEKASSRGVDLCAVVDGAVPDVVLGDAHRLRQVLLNLASNAVKFTERGSVVLTVELGESALGDPPVVRFSVKDTGRGIPAGALARIFEPFEQWDVSVARTHGGSGLGLAISQRLVGKMGGQIAVESAVGVGSEFFFSLVLPAAPASPIELTPPALGARRCLVVESDPTRRACLVRQLASWKLDVAASGEAEGAFTLLAGGASAEVVIADEAEVVLLAERCEAAGLSSPPVVAIVPFGRAARVTATSVAASVIRPVRPWALRAAIAAALGGDGQAAAPAAPLAPGLGLNVLVVDDNAVNREVATQMVARLGARTETASGGREAVELCGRQAYDCVLMDRRMPDVDGLAATMEIRRAEAASGRPPAFIVALTASATDEEQDSCLAAGMDAFVTKPFTLEDLAVLLERARTARDALPKG